MDIKILSWNIEHFDGAGGKATRGADRAQVMAARRDRVDRVVKLLKKEDPEVFGLSEVEGKEVHAKMVQQMPGYVFSITEGRQSQEILIGVKHGLTAFFTQRNEFKRSNPHLRPGALLTLTVRTGVHVPILFTHLKSSTAPEGFGLRDAMFEKVFKLRSKLDKAAGGAANFIVLGDMNTMGLNYVGKKFDIPGPDEIHAVNGAFKRRKMAALSKSHTATFSNGSGSKYPDADLDHVFAAQHLLPKFEKAADGSMVRVGGWAELTTPAKRDDWIEKFSDHAPLTFTLKI